MGAPAGYAADRRHRQRGHVVRRCRASSHTGRVRRGARRRIAALHRHHGLLRIWRHHHGPPGRSARHHSPARAGHAHPCRWLRRGRLCEQPVAVRARARLSHRLRVLGDVRALDRRYFPLVPASPRLGRGGRRQRQLSRRNRVATDCGAYDRGLRLALDILDDWSGRTGCHHPADAGASPPHACGT